MGSFFTNLGTSIIDKKIDSLRKLFTISVEVFEMQHSVSKAFLYKGQKSYMHNLYLIAKEEIDKDKPDLNKIEILLAMIEDCVKENSKELQTSDKFEKGGGV